MPRKTYYLTDRQERAAGGSVVERIKRGGGDRPPSGGDRSPTSSSSEAPPPNSPAGMFPELFSGRARGGGGEQEDIELEADEQEILPEPKEELGVYASTHAEPATFVREAEEMAAIHGEISAGKSTYMPPTLYEVVEEARHFEHKPMKQVFQRGTERALQQLEFLPHSFTGDVARGVALAGPMAAQTPIFLSDITDMPETTASDIIFSARERPGIVVGALLPSLLMGGVKAVPRVGTSRVVVAEGILPTEKGFAVPIEGSRGTHIAHVETLVARGRGSLHGEQFGGKYAGAGTVELSGIFRVPEFNVMAVQQRLLGGKEVGWVRTHGGGIEIGRMRVGRGGKVDIAATRKRILSEPESAPVWQDITFEEATAPRVREPLNLASSLEEWRASLIEPIMRGMGVPKGRVALFTDIPKGASKEALERAAKTSPQTRDLGAVFDLTKYRVVDTDIHPMPKRAFVPRQPPKSITPLSWTFGKQETVEIPASELKNVQKAVEKLTSSRKSSSYPLPLSLPRIRSETSKQLRQGRGQRVERRAKRGANIVGAAMRSMVGTRAMRAPKSRSSSVSRLSVPRNPMLPDMPLKPPRLRSEKRRSIRRKKKGGTSRWHYSEKTNPVLAPKTMLKLLVGGGK